MTDQEYLDRARLASYSACLDIALKNYGHICDTVLHRANRDSAECANAMLADRKDARMTIMLPFHKRIYRKLGQFFMMMAEG